MQISVFLFCSNFSLAYDLLNHLHGGNLIKPSWSYRTPLVGQMVVFNQEAFMDPPIIIKYWENRFFFSSMALE